MQQIPIWKKKLALYKTLVLPVLLYGAETWVLTDRDKQVLGVFEKKILRKIFGPVQILEEYRIRYNTDLYELYVDIGIIQCINIEILRWLGHIVQMDDGAPGKEVLQGDVKDNRRKGHQISGGKPKCRRSSSNLLLIIGEGVQMTALHGEA